MVPEPPGEPFGIVQRHVQSGDDPDFRRGQLAAIDNEVIHAGISQGPVVMPSGETEHAFLDGVLADEGGLIADVLVEIVPDDVDISGQTVDVELHPTCFAGAIIGGQHVGPLVQRQRLLGPDAHGIAGPEMAEGKRGAAFFENQLITERARIQPSAGVVDDHGAVGLFRGFDPDPDAERLCTGEVADVLHGSGVVATEEKSFAEMAGVELGLETDDAGLVRISAVDENPLLFKALKLHLEQWFRGLEGLRFVPQPAFKTFTRFFTQGLPLLLLHRDLKLHLRVAALLVLALVNEHRRRRDRLCVNRVKAAFVDVVQEGGETVVVPHGYGVILVVMAPGALHGEAEEGDAIRADTVSDDVLAELLFVAARFIALLREAVEGGGQEHVLRRRGQHVTGRLPSDELVVGQVVVEHPHGPVAVGPGETIVILVASISVRETGDIQPAHCHVLSVSVGGEEPVHHLLKGIGGVVCHKGIHFVQGRGQAGQVKRDAAQPFLAGGRFRRLDPGLFQLGEDECIDGVRAGRRRSLHDGQFRFHGGDEGPVLLVVRSLGNPSAQKREIGGTDRAVLLRRRHDLILVRGDEPFDELAFVRFARNDGLAGDGAGAVIKAELGFALLLVEPMAFEAMLCQDRLDDEVVTHLFLSHDVVRGNRS